MRTASGAYLVSNSSLPVTTVTTDSDTLSISGRDITFKVPDDPLIEPAPLLMYFHPGGGNGGQIAQPGPAKNITDYVSARGFVSIGVNIGDEWGSPTGNARAQEGRDYAVSELGANSLFWSGLSISMGGVMSVSYLHNESSLSECRGIFGIVPGVDLQDLHDNQGFASSIETAFGSEANYLAALDSVSPSVLAANGDLDGLVGKLWYAELDEAVPKETVEQFATDVGSTMDTVEMLGLTHLPGAGLADWVAISSAIIRVNPEISSQRRILL